VRAAEGVSRVELARQLHLAPSTAGTYVDRLIAEGFLFEQKKAERDFGRPPTLLALNPGGGKFIGLDFEAHNLMATVVDFSQKPIRQVHETILESDSVEQIICKIEGAIEGLMEGHPREVLGIGVGVPGIIDPVTQTALHYEHIPGWRNIPLGHRLASRFEVEVFLENNIRSMALAELWFGQGRGLDNFVTIGIRTGIAAGIIASGQLLHGNNNVAGEIGGWLCPVAPFIKGNGSLSWQCEQLRPLEQIASIPTILKKISGAIADGRSSLLRSSGTSISFENVVSAADAGDELVLEVLGSVAQTLGWVVCQINALFNPNRIILAGPLVKLGARFLDPLQGAVDELCAQSGQTPSQVVDSELGNFNGALGAAALALHQWKPKR
jgi:glucokinase